MSPMGFAVRTSRSRLSPRQCGSEKYAPAADAVFGVNDPRRVACRLAALSRGNRPSPEANMTLRAIAIRTGAGFADLVLPRTCAACGESTPPRSPDLCAACATEVMLTVGGDYCRTCGTDRAPHLMIDGRCTSCRQGKTVHRFERIVRVGRYEGALRRLILRFKREWVLEKLLGRLLADAIEAHIDPAEVDYWVPVPSHWRRRLVRGFHPTALLTARAVGRRKARLGSILEMTRFVPQLKGRMTATQRAAAVKGAFRVTHRRDISGRSVCLVDDVTTTGATLAEAKRALREAGARRIYAAVLAKTSAVRA